MQKPLKQTGIIPKDQRIRTQRRYQNGSALVTSLVFSIILSILGVGYLHVCRSTSNSEYSALENEKAFWAAESGLLLASRYARTFNSTTFPSPPGSAGTISVNGYTVTTGFSFASGKLSISATVDSIEGKFVKTISWHCASTASQYAHLYGQYIDKWDTVCYRGWGTSNVWKGRLHFNERIRLNLTTNSGSRNSFHFSGGMVTVARGGTGSWDDKTGRYGYDYTAKWLADHPGMPIPENEGGFRNSFNEGVEIYDNTPKSWTESDAPWAQDSFTNWFKDGFSANVEKVELSSSTRQDMLNSNPANVITLPISGTPPGLTAGPNRDDYRPTLVFDASANNVTYQYYSGGSLRDTIIDFRDKVLRVQTDVNVTGVIKGKASVITDLGKSINVVDDGGNSARGNDYPGLVYNDYSCDPVLGGTVSSPDDAIALVSGANIVFNASWKKYWKDMGSAISDTMRSHTLNAGTEYEKHVLHVNGALIATETPTSSARIDLDEPKGNFYRIYAFGSNMYSSYRMQSYSGKGIPTDTISSRDIGNIYDWDTRLINDVFVPNSPMVRSESGLLQLSFHNWTEENTVK
jgi:Tfp pilus assembly protein PilX